MTTQTIEDDQLKKFLKKRYAIIIGLIAIVAVVSIGQWAFRDKTSEVMVINASRQRIPSVTVTVPGAEVTFSDMAPNAIGTANVPLVATGSMTPSQHGHLANGTEIGSNGLRGGNEGRITHWVYVVGQDGVVDAMLDQKANPPSSVKTLTK